MASITLKEVEEIAELARLRLQPSEAQGLTRDLASILDYVDQLRAIDTTGVEPMTHAVPMACPLREDTVAPGLDPEAVMAGAPRRDGDFFQVPRIIDPHPSEAGQR